MEPGQRQRRSRHFTEEPELLRTDRPVLGVEKRRGGLYDHFWDPDLLRAIERYSSLYPEDLELRNLYKMYLRILYEKQL